MNEQSLIDIDTVLDTLEAIEKDVYRPDMYSQERLSKLLRERMRAVTDLMRGHRQEVEQIVYAEPKLNVIEGGKAS